jgi:hypothetical protein
MNAPHPPKCGATGSFVAICVAIRVANARLPLMSR